MHQMHLVQAWSPIQAPSSGVLDTSFSLHPTNILEQHNSSLEEKSRQAWRSPTGGAQAFQSDYSQSASSLQFLDALEESLAEEQELSETSHITQLRAEVSSLQNLLGTLCCYLIASTRMTTTACQSLEKNMCTAILNMCGIELAETSLQKKKGISKLAAQQLASKTKGNSRVDYPENMQQQKQLEQQQKQEQQQEGQLRPDLSSQQKLEQRGKPRRSENKACITRSAAYPSKPQGEPDQLLRTRWCRICWKMGHDTQACWYNSQQDQQHRKQKAWKQTNKTQQQTAAASEQQLQTKACNNSLGIGEQEPMGSLEQPTLACRPPMQPWRILVDTGAELSVAPRSFASHIQLSPLEEDLELRTASGIAIQTFGTRTVQLLSQGFSFRMSFVIADVEQPLLGLSGLLRESLSLHVDSNLGHHLGNTAGEKIQLEQRGQQIYLSACPTELGLTHCMMGNLLKSSLLP